MATFLSSVALLVAVVGFALVWKVQQDQSQITRRLDRYNKALFDANDELGKLREELAESKAALHVELMQRTGTVRFAPEMTVREATRIHPQVQQILAGFHLGGCDSCAVEPDETLAQICQEKGISEDSLLGTLNLLVGASGGSNGNGAAAVPQFVKVPNVALEL